MLGIVRSIERDSWYVQNGKDIMRGAILCANKVPVTVREVHNFWNPFVDDGDETTNDENHHKLHTSISSYLYNLCGYESIHVLCLRARALPLNI